MTREQLFNNVPPCGLMCYTCPGYIDDATKEHSAALLKLKEGFGEFLDKKLSDDYRYVLEKYDKYIEMLTLDSTPSCPGCRKAAGKGPSCIEGCFIPRCTKEHGVDFCGVCNEFPCNKVEESNLYDKECKKGFYEGSSLIKEHGAEKFFEMKKNISHYINYAK